MKKTYRCYVIALQFCFAVITGLINGPGVCKDGGGKLRCCTNFQLKNDNCKPCEVGTYGVNCTGGHCDYGRYGFGCLNTCNCTTDQYCDRKIGCKYNTTNDSDISAVKNSSYVGIAVAVALAVILSLGSFLVLIVFIYNKGLKFLRQYFTRLRTNQAENDNTRRESEESQEDYSEMTRASNNYNMLSFNRRFNVVSRVNPTDDEDVYDQGGAVIPDQTEEFQDSYVALALKKNHVMFASNALKKVIYDKEEGGVADKTRCFRDSYVTLALNPNYSSESTENNKEITGKGSKQETQTGRSIKGNQDFYANTLPKLPSSYFVLENTKPGTPGKKRQINDTL